MGSVRKVSVSLVLIALLTGCQSDPTAPTDIRPPDIDELSVLASADCATISWFTDRPARSNVAYGASVQYGRTTRDTTFSVYHTAVLRQLAPETVHYFSVEVIGQNGLRATVSGDFQTFMEPVAELSRSTTRR